MLELAEHLLPALRAGESVAVVTVARVARSAPRGAGAAMAVLADGRVIGSISGGCVEGDAVLLASGVLARGGAVTATLGFSDESAHAAGLACGGSVDVVVHRADPRDAVLIAALERAASGRRTRVGIVVDGAGAGRGVDVDDLVSTSETCILPSAYGAHDVLMVVRQPRPRLVIAGAGEHAMALSRVASAAGFSVSVVDVWERLVTRERFPTADRIDVGDPAALLPALVGDEAATAAVCVLTHDERVDVPALAAALRLHVGFVGAMGARGTVARRRELLTDAGVGPHLIDRVRSPLGLDLGGSSPDETAIAVLAEIIAARRGGSARPLRDTRGPLHSRVGLADEVDGAAGPRAARPGAALEPAASCALPERTR
jgi:xanthine dehydrogenase accessory factor